MLLSSLKCRSPSGAIPRSCAPVPSACSPCLGAEVGERIPDEGACQKSRWQEHVAHLSEKKGARRSGGGQPGVC
eukprot:3933323-Alexandrium_andersonii.AAC.1